MSSAQASGMEESFQELHVKVRTENTCYKCGFSYPHKINHAQPNTQFALHVASLDILQNFVVRNNKRLIGSPCKHDQRKSQIS